MTTDWGFDTLQIHAGASPDPATRARVTPIYQSASFTYESTDQAAASFLLDDLDGFAYSRISNPTTAAAERRIAALEKGTAAVAVASGQAATTVALLNLLRAGGHVVASDQVYGGTTNLLLQRFPELGIDVSLVSDINNPDAWRRHIRPTTRAFFAESIGNPTGAVLDIPAIAEVAHRDAGVPLVIDNTLATPYLLRPIVHGADIVVHSTTKYLAGHGTSIGGVVVDAGTFDFGADPHKWPGLHGADVGHGDRSYWERFGADGIAYALRLRTTLVRDYGPAPSPFNSFLLLQGLETLSLRVRQHVANAEAVVAFLHAHPLVERVHYPTAHDAPWRDIARRLLPRGAGGVVSFDLAGGRDAARAFVESLELFSHLANIGDVRSLVIHPASTVNSGLTDEQLHRAGIGPGLLRLSIGTESADDLIRDLERGFAASALTARRIDPTPDLPSPTTPEPTRSQP
ncbi:O-acetylhomoserine aminocarboxypropyltransferase/cysteine synthase family protein [Microbacterium sp. SORGH_AS_0862]|uniref:O-acetylhomoserine aminocarboxypropyltransferase/cysteine synthase family protein n=1 Tax=Microbacterium sp. SORGH_AS_0862 TaxID=3041789 RepID=UPI002790C372|nr:O-acetylhomoserine aminocarboxypropyltransferase/cysteine synthase family protein [Microbacterium sp. SORGH_AS_0862]MDQ1205712.1 O-acetylhomoserine (thiol)-lyase [Microbacterium sp. SORGH_AS_0862]